MAFTCRYLALHDFDTSRRCPQIKWQGKSGPADEQAKDQHDDGVERGKAVSVGAARARGQSLQEEHRQRQPACNAELGRHYAPVLRPYPCACVSCGPGTVQT